MVNILSAIFRIHRSIMSSTYNGMPQLASQFGDYQDNRSSRQALTSQILSSKALHSWVYPQSTLPATVISVLTSSATEGGCQIKTLTHINCFLFPSFFLFLTFSLFICGDRFYKKTATGVGGFFSESLLHASKEHMQYFLWYFSAHVLLNHFLFFHTALYSVFFPQTRNIMCKISILLFPRIIIVETYYLDLVDVTGCLLIFILTRSPHCILKDACNMWIMRKLLSVELYASLHFFSQWKYSLLKLHLNIEF